MRSSSPDRRKELKEELSRFKKEAKELSMVIQVRADEARRRELLLMSSSARAKGGEGSALLSGETDREREALDRSGRALESSKTRLVEMESVARGISEELERNNSTIRSARGKVGETLSLTGQARGILRNMARHEFRTKMMVYGAVATVVLILLIGVYYIVFPDKGGVPSSSSAKSTMSPTFASEPLAETTHVAAPEGSSSNSKVPPRSVGGGGT